MLVSDGDYVQYFKSMLRACMQGVDPVPEATLMRLRRGASDNWSAELDAIRTNLASFRRAEKAPLALQALVKLQPEAWRQATLPLRGCNVEEACVQLAACSHGVRQLSMVCEARELQAAFFKQAETVLVELFNIAFANY